MLIFNNTNLWEFQCIMRGLRKIGKPLLLQGKWMNMTFSASKIIFCIVAFMVHFTHPWHMGYVTYCLALFAVLWKWETATTILHLLHNSEKPLHDTALLDTHGRLMDQSGVVGHSPILGGPERRISPSGFRSSKIHCKKSLKVARSWLYEQVPHY